MPGKQRRLVRRMPFRGSSGRSGSGRVGATLRALLVLVVAAIVLGSALAYSLVRRGLSAHDEPSRAEVVMARTMRRLATPAAIRSRTNPVEPTTTVIRGGLEHWADHCATCHANDGSGKTEIGRGLYPKAPDMRLDATQSLSDGELFSIIEHGIRLTGMPAWGTGTPEGERDSWALVHFIRRLPVLSAEDLERMEGLNPKTPAQFKRDDEARRFLAGESDAPAVQGDVHGH